MNDAIIRRIAGTKPGRPRLRACKLLDDRGNTTLCMALREIEDCTERWVRADAIRLVVLELAEHLRVPDEPTDRAVSGSDDQPPFSPAQQHVRLGVKRTLN